MQKLRALGDRSFPAAEYPVTHTATKVKEDVQGRASNRTWRWRAAS